MTCRSCGAEIIFVKTDSGKNMPLSIKSKEKRFVIHPVGGGSNTVLLGKLTDTYISHFADCPTADQHRQKDK